MSTRFLAVDNGWSQPMKPGLLHAACSSSCPPPPPPQPLGIWIRCLIKSMASAEVKPLQIWIHDFRLTTHRCLSFSVPSSLYSTFTEGGRLTWSTESATIQI